MRLTGLGLIVVTSALIGCKTLPTQKTTLPPAVPGFSDSTSELPAQPDWQGDKTQILLHVDTNQVTDQLELGKRSNGTNLRDKLYSSFQDIGLKIKGDKDLSQMVNQLKQEISKGMKVTNAEFKGEQKVNYFVNATLIESSLNMNYSDPHLGDTVLEWATDKKPIGSCGYDMKARVQIDLYQLPSLESIETISVEDSDDFSVDANAHCQKPTTRIPEAYNKFVEGQNDILGSISACAGRAVQEALSPKAYVTDYLSDGEQHIFKVSAGELAGFEDGDSVIFQRPRESGGFEKIASGTVYEAESKFSFIEVSSLNEASKIIPNDRVKLTSKGALDSLSKSFKDARCYFTLK